MSDLKTPTTDLVNWLGRQRGKLELYTREDHEAFRACFEAINVAQACRPGTVRSDGFLRLDQLGAELRQKREHGIRQTAREIGVSPTTLSKAENGHLPDTTTLLKLCEWCGLSIHLVYEGEQQ